MKLSLRSSGILVVLVGGACLCGDASAQWSVGWERQFGTPTFDTAWSVSAVADAVYVAGGTYGVLPGQTQVGGGDAFVRKYDLDGKELWTRQFGTAADDFAFTVSATADGVYAAGYTGGAFPGYASSGKDDIFVRKYDPNGNELWTRQFGSTDPDNAWGVSAAADGVYVVGIGGILPGQGAFVRKYDLNGNQLWNQQYSTGTGDGATAVSAVADGVYVAGNYYSDSSDYGAYVRRYDLNGNQLWNQQFDLGGFAAVWALSAAADGVYAAGQSRLGAFVRKYDLNGNELWTRETVLNSSAHGVSATANGVLVIWESDAGTFVSQYDSNGQTTDVSSFAVGGFRAIDASTGRVFASGAVNFGPGCCNSEDALVARLVRPVSYVSPLPALEPNPTFTVQWSGTDDGGPGIQDYTIYVSDNGAPFTAWLTQTAATQALFTGASWHRYGFYSIARTTASAVEFSKTAAETTTQIADSTKPVSNVSPLPATEFSPSFTVQWSGTDTGSGIGGYTIYVSDNGGPFTAWLTQTTATQGLFTGITAHTYGFYSIARDVAGNVESPKFVAEATTLVNTTKPVSHVSPLPAAVSALSFAVQWSGTDTGGPGIQDYTIYVSDNGGSFTAWLTQTSATQASFTGTAGHTYGFYSIARDSAGSVEPPKSAAEGVTLVDTTKPASHVSPLAAAESIPTFTVQWSGTDTGSGIANYDIYTSDNGGSFTAWLTQTVATQASFTGTNGHTYSFYSIARDVAGNVESPKSAAEATTLVDTTKPASHVSPLSATVSALTFTVQWSGTDAGGPGIQDYTIYVSDNGGPFAAWLTQTAATQASFTGATGHTYGFYSIARDSAGIAESPKPSAEATTLVDTTKPVSQVSPLPATVSNPTFTVQWSGTDTGSGVHDYTVYVSDNGGPFNAWQTQTAATQASFVGITGHTYGFYSIARDVAGNQEPPKAAAEATTLVDTTKPVSHVSPLPETVSVPTFTVQWSGTDTGSGVHDYTIYGSDNGGPFAVWLTQTAATQASYTGITGHTYGFYSIARDVAGNPESPKAAAEATTLVDTTKPVSHVSPLPATVPVPTFTVQWSGTDTGSGVHDYTIYASDNGGPFVAWLTQTAATQASYTGITGHTYGFYSIARDVAGNMELPKSVAEAATLVITTALVSHVSALPATATSSNFLVKWSGTETGGPGIQGYTIYVSDNGGPFTAWLNQTPAIQAWYAGYMGHTYGFYSIARDLSGNQEGAKAAPEATTRVPAQMAADANGDGQITCADVTIVKASFGKMTGQPGFVPAADVNKDGVVNVLDLAAVTQKLIPGTTCQ